jgi:hypothetical protein
MMVKNKKNHTQIYVCLSFQCIFYCEREWQEVDDIISHMWRGTEKEKRKNNAHKLSLE